MFCGFLNPYFNISIDMIFHQGPMANTVHNFWAMVQVTSEHCFLSRWPQLTKQREVNIFSSRNATFTLLWCSQKCPEPQRWFQIIILTLKKTILRIPKPDWSSILFATFQASASIPYWPQNDGSSLELGEFTITKRFHHQMFWTIGCSLFQHSHPGWFSGSARSLVLTQQQRCNSHTVRSFTIIKFSENWS